MGQRYTFNYLWIIIIAIAISVNCAFAYTIVPPAKTDTSYLFKSRVKKSLLKSGVISGNISLFKPSAGITKSAATAKQADDKILSNVQTYPILVTDQINLRYTVSRNANVTIKIVDVLGNNVATLFSQRVDPGEQKFTHYLTSRLTSGFYYVRVVTGTESVIKRITVL